MTPEEYINELKSVQYTLSSIQDDIEKAIYKMQRRIETGYESMEKESKLATLTGHSYTKLIEEELLKIGTTKIEF